MPIFLPVFTNILHKLECNGSFTLADSDAGTDSDSDSKPNGYIVLCRTFHITWTRIPTSYFCVGQESKSVSGNVNEPLNEKKTSLENCSNRNHVFTYEK